MKLVIFGAGGHAREVADLIATGSNYEHVGFVDKVQGGMLDGIPVLSWEQFSHMYSPGAVSVITAIGDPKLRLRVAKECADERYDFATLVHPSVRLSHTVELGPGTIIFPGCVLTINISIGRHVYINVGCTISHDVRIGDNSFLAPGVHVSGNVAIGRSVWIGTGASITNGTPDSPLVIGDGTVVGAGSAVIKSCEPGCLYAGVPAVIKKRY